MDRPFSVGRSLFWKHSCREAQFYLGHFRDYRRVDPACGGGIISKADRKGRLSFLNFSGLDAGRADFHASNGSVGETDFDSLQIDKEAPAGDACDLLTHSAAFLGQTAPSDRVTNPRTFTANLTKSHDPSPLMTKEQVL